MIGWQHDEGHWPAGGNGVASSRGNKIKEKKRVAWRETNQSYEKKNQLYGQNHKFNNQQTIPNNMTDTHGIPLFFLITHILKMTS